MISVLRPCFNSNLNFKGLGRPLITKSTGCFQESKCDAVILLIRDDYQALTVLIVVILLKKINQ